MEMQKLNLWGRGVPAPSKTRKLTTDGQRLVVRRFLSPKKAQISISWGVWIQLPTFYADSKSAKISKSHFFFGWGGGLG